MATSAHKITLLNSEGHSAMKNSEDALSFQLGSYAEIPEIH
jgi:hypothetical protein